MDGMLDIVKKLVAIDDVDLDLGNTDNETGIMVAAREGRHDIVSFLLDYTDRYDINWADYLGQSVFHHVCMHDWLDIVERLCTINGIRMDLKTDDNDTVILTAARYGRYPIVRYLLQYADRFDTDARGSDRKTLLDFAIENGWWDFVEDSQEIQSSSPSSSSTTATVSSSSSNTQRSETTIDFVEDSQEIQSSSSSSSSTTGTVSSSSSSNTTPSETTLVSINK